MHSNFRKGLLAAAMIGDGTIGFRQRDHRLEREGRRIRDTDGNGCPPLAQSMIAIVQVAMFDAVNSIERRYRPYWSSFRPLRRRRRRPLPPPRPAPSWSASIRKDSGRPEGRHGGLSRHDSRGDAKSAGIKLGEAVAAKVLEARANDGSDAPDAYRPRTRPGVYVPTPITVSSTWPNMKPFALASAVAIPAGAAGRAQERAVGHRLQRDQGFRRQDQHEAFRPADRRRPLLAHHRPQSTEPFVRQIVAAKKMSLIDSARFMALVAVAGGRCRHCGVRCQVSLRLLASDHRHPQRRYRRQSGHRARRDLAADRRTRRCIRNIRARTASSAARSRLSSRRCSARLTFRKSP